MIIGLTGPVGAGKNAAAKILRRRGAYIIDVDQVAHTLYEPQSEVWREMVKALGSKILKRGGEINRKKLGEIVFSDKKRLQQLNSIVHPRLKDEIVKIVESRTLNVDRRIEENDLQEHLYTKDMPDPDLLIRTASEMRISNFLLWQIAYSEIYVTEKLWPDFRRGELIEAIEAYQKRERRFGKVL